MSGIAVIAALEVLCWKLIPGLFIDSLSLRAVKVKRNVDMTGRRRHLCACFLRNRVDPPAAVLRRRLHERSHHTELLSQLILCNERGGESKQLDKWCYGAWVELYYFFLYLFCSFGVRNSPWRCYEVKSHVTILETYFQTNYSKNRQQRNQDGRLMLRRSGSPACFL